MNNNIQEAVGQIQLIQQNLENFSSQRQQFTMQETEIETALTELTTAKTAYKIIGNIMVLVDTETLKKELEEKKQVLSIRVKTIEKQEAKLHAKVEELQKEVMSQLEEKNTKKKSEKPTHAKE